MIENTDNNKIEKNELLDIFVNEEDQRGTDILAMSDFFDVYISKIEAEMGNRTKWELYLNIDGIIGEISAAIKTGFDISKVGMLVADYSHFSKDIIDGLKNGLYHVGESREISGNLRPAILDDKEQLVKFFTLKKACDPTSVLANLSTLSMQSSLQRISAQIEEIGMSVKGIIDFSRREALSNKFIYAREKIMLASTAKDEDERNLLIHEADTYLLEGLGSLYGDLNAQICALSDNQGAFSSIKTVDNLLSYINEDMQMIPRYVGLRVYLYNFQGRNDVVGHILGDYRYQLQKLSDTKINGKLTALELIHKNYPYNNSNIDFWLEKPKQMIEGIDSYNKMLEQKDKDLYYIDMEISKNE